jgi:DNA ligase (NAD+)
VPVAGTRVARATLHNMDEIERLDVRIGDTVIIEKAGDIIPDIVQVLITLRPKNARQFAMPKVCPVCNSPVVHAEGEVAYYCSNTECEGKSREQLYHFVSKVAMDIDGLGPKIIDQLVEQDLIRTPADLYLLRPEDLMVLEGFKEKSTHNLIAAIQASSRVSLKRFIFALGIRHVGELMAQALAEHFLTIKKLMNASTEELDSIENIGPAVIESLKMYFENPKHRTLVEQLLEHSNTRQPLRVRPLRRK